MSDKRIKKIINEWVLKEEEGNVIDFGREKAKRGYADIRRKNEEERQQMGVLGDMPEAMEQIASTLRDVGAWFQNEGSARKVAEREDLRTQAYQDLKRVHNTLIRMAQTIKKTTRG